MTRPKCIGSMASHPGRRKTLSDVVEAIAPQLDTLYLYLNEYDRIPEELNRHANVVPLLGYQHRGDLSAAGKMIFLTHENSGQAFVLDDDIIYPPDYVETMLAIHDSLGGNVGICVHGSIIPDSASWYYERSVIYDVETELTDVAAVNLIGSGTFSYRIEDGNLTLENFLGPVQVDLTISKSFLAKGMPLVACPRRRGWLQFLPYEGMTRSLMRTLTHHTLALRDRAELSYEQVMRVWDAHFARHPEARYPREILQGLAQRRTGQDKSEDVRPIMWQATDLSLKKSLEFSAKWCSRTGR